MAERKKPDLKAVEQLDLRLDSIDSGEGATSIPKPPKKFSLDKFKSTQAPTISNVDTLPHALPIHSIAQAKDFVRLHHLNEYWSTELCFVSVPVVGVKGGQLHLIDESIGMRYCAKKLLRFRLALGSKPFDVFFLCIVPSTNLLNSWNESAVQACMQARVRWVQADSRKDEGHEHYKISYAHDEDAFPNPRWPRQSLEEIIGTTFEGRNIETDTHPALLRLIGKKQDVS
jgi:hypothetical protein